MSNRGTEFRKADFQLHSPRDRGWQGGRPDDGLTGLTGPSGNEKNDLALIPKGPSALEKAEPGRKRILTNMVADTLAIVRKGPTNIQVSGSKSAKQKIYALVCAYEEVYASMWTLN